MKGIGRTPRIALLCALAFSAGAIVAAELPRHTIKIVVLRNGNVLKGVVRSENQRLVISDGDARVTRVSLNDVDFISENLQAAYRRKLSRLEDGNVEQHLRLAQWCLRYDLSESAGDRLVYLHRIAPRNSAVRAFESRMRKMVRDQMKSTDTPEIVQRRAEASKSETSKIDGLPASAVPQFTRVVQPLMLNRCGQTTCHGSATQSTFRLTRGLRGNPNRELTWKNLAAVIDQVQNKRFDRSPLLLQARSIHGNSRVAPIEAHETVQFEHLYAWVKLVTNTKDPSDSEIQDEAEAAFEFAKSGVQQDVTNNGKALQNRSQQSDVLPSHARKSLEGKPVDPFDPTDFNAEHAAPPSSSED
ncbi:MAG: hypothetical protein GY768_08910 [Planctomycetaceae bacterium]|nr:hypothetical protein [Planctomycetaceae bacterium]